MDEGNKGLGIGSTGKELKKAIKEGTLFSKPNVQTGGTGYAPNADLAKPEDELDQLQQIAEGANPEHVKKAAEAAAKAQAYNPQDYENTRSQSLVYSQREVTEAQLAAVRAQNEAAVRAQQRQIAEEKAKQTGLKIGIIVLIVFLAITGIILTILVLNSQRKPVAPEEKTEAPAEVELPTVEGYDCETELCGKVAGLPDGRIILRDTAYFVYNLSNKERLATTIEPQDYNEVKSFLWGGKIYLTLDPNSDPTALFSLAENRYITSYVYDSFYTNINDAAYNDMHQVEGKYIVAKSSGSLKLINLTNGKAVASGKNRVFVHDGYYFGYEDGSMIYAYNSNGKVITTLKSNSSSQLFTRAGKLIVVRNGEDIEIFDQNGEFPNRYGFDEKLDELNYSERLNYLRSNAAYYKIPAN